MKGERALVFETHGRLGGDGTALLRDLVTTAAAIGQCSPFAVGRWRYQLRRHTCLRALSTRVATLSAAGPPAREHPLLLVETSQPR